MDFRRCDVHALVAVLAVGSTCSVLHGETFVLDPDDGPPSRVQDAIDAAENGDVILLTSGTWTWGVDYGQLDFQGKAITLEGESDGSTIVSLALKPESTPAILIQSGESESTTRMPLMHRMPGLRCPGTCLTRRWWTACSRGSASRVPGRWS